MIANPFTVLEHVSRVIDAAGIAMLARENDARLIVVGQALDYEGKPSPQGRRAARLARAIQEQIDLPVVLWDESGSTQAAQRAHIEMGGTRNQRKRRGRGHLDDLAATFILQSYLDANNPDDD